MSAPIPAGWYPDPAPAAPGEGAMLRWWDGAAWSEHRRPAEPQARPAGHAQPTGHAQPAGHVTGPEYGGRAQFGAAPPAPPAAGAQGRQPGYQPGQQQQPVANGPQQQQGHGQHGHGQQGHGQHSHQPGFPGGRVRSPYTEPRMAVSQRRKIIELTNEYDVYGSDGAVIGFVAEVNQSGLKKAARFLTSLDQFMTHTLEVRDSAGQPFLVLTRPAKIVKSTLIVSHPHGGEIGRLVQRNVFGKIRFGMEAGGQEIGSLNAQNWIAWNFEMQDAHGRAVGRITKTFEGVLTTMFTTADTYAVDLDPNLTEPLKSLCIAAALCVDTALKQDSRGLG